MSRQEAEECLRQFLYQNLDQNFSDHLIPGYIKMNVITFYI